MPSDVFERLSDAKRQTIVSAAIHEFSLHGLHSAKLSNIVNEAGIARGSIYQYFPTKEDLYVYLFDTLRAKRGEFVKPAFELYKKASFLDFFESFYLRDSSYLLMNPSHIELGKQLYGSADPVSQGLIERLQRQYHSWFLVAIESDVERGIMSRTIDIETLTDLFVHFVTDIFIFQSVRRELSLPHIKEHWQKLRFILEHGILRL